MGETSLGEGRVQFKPTGQDPRRVEDLGEFTLECTVQT